jgi:hypothetical protein
MVSSVPPDSLRFLYEWMHRQATAIKLDALLGPHTYEQDDKYVSDADRLMWAQDAADMDRIIGITEQLIGELSAGAGS